MEGKIPIILDGSEAGEVEMRREGPMTVFQARCEAREELLRLSVYGMEGEGYLGVMMPAEGGLVLKRSFTPLAMRQFPSELIQAGRAGQGRAAPENKPEVKEPAEPVQPEPPEEPEKPEAPEEPEETETPDEIAKEPVPAPEPVVLEEPEAPQEPAEDNYYWYASPDGALVCFDGENNLIALPEGDERIPENYAGEERIIMGERYFVYRTKDGRIVREAN